MKGQLKKMAILLLVVMLFGSISLSVGASDDTQILGYRYGDVTADLLVNAEDALAVLNDAAGIVSLSELMKEYADVNDDMLINAEDALLILQYSANVITKFPAEETLPTAAPTVVPTPVPTPEPTPEPTPDPTEKPKADYTPIDIEYMTLNDAATYADGTYTFLNSANAPEGVELKNPFVGHHPTLGGTVSFWINSPIEIEKSYNYESLLVFTDPSTQQLMKFDLQGTRQYGMYATGNKMNYWAAYMPIQASQDAFITFVMDYNGLKVYMNGEEIELIDYAGNDDAPCRDQLKEFITNPNTRMYLGGTENVISGSESICKNKMYEGITIWNLQAYKGAMNDTMVKALYSEQVEAGIGATPAPEATMSPEELRKARPVDVTPVKETLVATVEHTTVTFADPTGHRNGLEVKNPFAGIDNGKSGGTLSFWYTPAVDESGTDYGYTGLVTFADPGKTQILKFDSEGTRQYQNAVTKKILNYYDTDVSMKAGTEYFITVVVNDNGLHFYVNGVLTSGGYSKSDESTARGLSMEFLFAENTRMFIGGTEEVNSKYVDLLYHKMPANTVVRDLTAYYTGFNATEVMDLYETAKLVEPE